MTIAERRRMVAQQFREARKTPEGRAAARIAFLAMRETRKQLLASFFVKDGALSRIVRGEA